MVYSDTSGKSGLLQLCEYYCGYTDAGISGDATLKAQFTGGLNRGLHLTVADILQAQDETDWDDINYTTYPIGLIDLVASQQDYTVPASTKLLKLKRVEITYDGTTWYKATPFELNERDLASDTTSISNDFSTSEPFYEFEANAFKLYPVPTADSAAGLKFWFMREPDEFATSDTTQEPGIDEPFHPMLALYAAKDYFIRQTKFDKVREFERMLEDFRGRLKAHYGSKQKDRDYRLDGVVANYH